MPELHASVRAQGGHAAAEPWPDHDWSILTDAATRNVKLEAVLRG